jgi:phage protein
MELIKDSIKFAASLLIVMAAVGWYSYLMYQSGYAQAKSEAQPIIIHKADNAGAEMHGRITDKELIEGRYTVTAGAYGKFLVTEEQYEAIKVGDLIPNYLKGAGR